MLTFSVICAIDLYTSKLSMWTPPVNGWKISSGCAPPPTIVFRGNFIAEKLKNATKLLSASDSSLKELQYATLVRLCSSFCLIFFPQ